MTWGTQTGTQDLRRGDGEGDGRQVQVGGDVGVPVADSC